MKPTHSCHSHDLPSRRGEMSRGDRRFVFILMLMIIALLSLHFLSHASAADDLPLPPPPVLDDPDLFDPDSFVELVRDEGAFIPVEGVAADEPPALEEIPSVDLAYLGDLDQEISMAPPPSSAPAPAERWGEPLSSNEVRAMLADVEGRAPGRLALESMLFEQLRAALPGAGDDCVFERATLPDTLDLPNAGWQVRYTFRLPRSGVGATPFTGVVTDPAGAVLRRFSGSVWVDREATGVQPTRVIRRGEVISPADVQAVPARLSVLPRGAMTRLDLAENTLARQELRPGQWLTDSMLDVPEVVKRNQPVTIRLARGPLQITTHGVAREGGALGEIVRVENLQSRRVIFARVLSPDEVQVIY